LVTKERLWKIIDQLLIDDERVLDEIHLRLEHGNDEIQHVLRLEDFHFGLETALFHQLDVKLVIDETGEEVDLGDDYGEHLPRRCCQFFSYDQVLEEHEHGRERCSELMSNDGLGVNPALINIILIIQLTFRFFNQLNMMRDIIKVDTYGIDLVKPN